MVRLKKLKSRKARKFIILATIFMIFNIIVVSYNLGSNLPIQTNQDNSNINNQGVVLDQYEKEWIKNGEFNLPVDPWVNEEFDETSDLQASASNGAANYDVLGDNGTYTFAQSLISTGWKAVKNPNFPSYPDRYEINESGACVSHYWEEGADQSVAVNWEQNISLPINMSDYTITSANIKSVVNGSVHVPSYQDINFNSDGVEAGNDLGTNTTQYATGDYVRYYVLISDIPKNNIYEIAYNQTTNLGQDCPEVATMGDTLMIPVTEDSLKFYLSSVLSNDYQNFTISIGMRIWCEDNFAQDSDWFKLLCIKSVNLTFTYEKKMNQLSTLTWKQEGNQIPVQNTNIVSANLTFKYKINNTWTSESPNSELRIKIGNNLFGETLKLSSAPLSFQDAKTGGFDVTSLITKGVNITLSIQLYIADQFELDRNIRISIDNVSLMITYTVSTTEDVSALDLILNNYNRTIEKSVTVTYGKNVNITAIYKNSTNGFISNASLSLSGTNFASQDLTENKTLEHYYIILNSTIFGVGETYLTLEASKRYFETREVTILINVINRDTELELFLNGEDKTLDKSQIVDYGTTLNVTVFYKDIEYATSKHIENATVQLTGVGPVKDLTESIQHNNYYILIETNKLGVGNSYLTVEAQKQNYTIQSIRFKIEVQERDSYLDLVYLNYVQQTYVEQFWNETVNIRTSYNDTGTDNFISGASLSLIGVDFALNFTEMNTYYELNITTRKLSIGLNFLTISAERENYTSTSKTITINVKERTTTLTTYLKGIQSTSLSIPWNETIDIEISYNDSVLNKFISGAGVSLTGSDLSETLSQSGERYQVTINSRELTLGPNFLIISAKQDNYTLNTKTITITVIRRTTSLTTYLNNIKTSSISSGWNETLNIKVQYNDSVLKQFISGANVTLT
ncbi:MAG: hypothetical protein EU549_03855, partial [Promethearchaeota archaeon]